MKISLSRMAAAALVFGSTHPAFSQVNEPIPSPSQPVRQVVVVVRHGEDIQKTKDWIKEDGTSWPTSNPFDTIYPFLKGDPKNPDNPKPNELILIKPGKGENRLLDAGLVERLPNEFSKLHKMVMTVSGGDPEVRSSKIAEAIIRPRQADFFIDPKNHS